MFLLLLAAFTLPEKPAMRVNDYAHVLTPQAQVGLEQKFASFERQTGHQAAVAIFENLGDQPVEDVATRLYEKWRLGSAKGNDGVLLVLGMKEHAVRIEVGYGLEGQLPDALAGRIIHEQMTPHLKEGNVATAVLVFEKDLERIFIQGEHLAPPRRGRYSLKNVVIVVLLWLFLTLFIGRNRTRYARTLGGGTVRHDTWWVGGGGGWSSGGGSSSGGWGGGGGGLSGGGGASGSW